MVKTRSRVPMPTTDNGFPLLPSRSMPSPSRLHITATQIYDVTTCPHRLHLDATLDRDLRTPPDPAAALLLRSGIQYEARIAAELGYVEVATEGGNERAAATTRELMRSGVPGIVQGVLRDGRFLARPDLLERADGRSALGAWHYVPGDIKSALVARTDAALQIAFAGRLLETVQAVRPDHGFVVLGDGRRERVHLEGIALATDDAMALAVAVVDGERETRPFFSSHCGRCRWRGACVPGMVERRDASLVHGMTPTIHRVLARHGVVTVQDLAAADIEALRRAGAPTDTIARLQRQAQALAGNRVVGKRAVDLPRGGAREAYLRIESDPLDHGEPFLFCWARGPAGGGRLSGVTVLIAENEEARGTALRRLLAELDEPAERGSPIYSFGGATGGALDALADRFGVEPGIVGDIEGRIVDLAPWVRRAAALPVVRYTLEEVAAVAVGGVEVGLSASGSEADDALFVSFAVLRELDGGEAEEARSVIERRGAELLESIRVVRRWIG